MKKTVICLITRDKPNPDCYDSLLRQEYDNFTILTHSKRPRLYHPHEQKNKYLNASENRNIARQMALTTDAEEFFFIDDDTILPSHALPEMLSYNMDIVGGWYQMKNSTHYAAGKYREGCFFNYATPQPGIIEVDMIGLGCILLSRKVVEQIPFEHGLDQVFNHSQNGIMLGGDSLAFAKKAQDKGFRLYMTDTVICHHVQPSPTKEIS